MKRILFWGLLLLAVPGWAQFSQSWPGPSKNVPPTLTFRSGNFNEVDMLLTQAGVSLTPSSSLTVLGEVRLVEAGRVLNTIPFVLGDTASGSLRAILPDLAAQNYKLGLVLLRPGLPPFSAGLANLVVTATGTLNPITTANGLSVSINQVTNLLSVQLDASPSANIAAYYYNQAKLVLEQVQSTVQGGATRIYAVSGIASGFLIIHNKTNSLVSGLCFRTDTGQVDELWKVRIVSASTIALVGPPNETLSGKIELRFPITN